MIAYIVLIFIFARIVYIVKDIKDFIDLSKKGGHYL